MSGTEPIRPSLWYAALSIPILAATFMAVGWMFVRDVDRVRNSMAYADVPGQIDVNLKRSLHYTIYVEQISDGTSAMASPAWLASKVSCELHALPYGDNIPLNKPSGSTTFTYGSSSGVSILEFDVPQDGIYVLGCQDYRGRPGPKLRVAVGSGASEVISVAVLKCVIVLIAGGVIALLIFVRVLMLRDQSKREIRARGLRPV